MNVYPLPITEDRDNSIQRLFQSIRGNCKTCKGTGKGNSYTNKFHLKTYKECPDCTKELEDKISFICAGIPMGHLNINKIHPVLEKNDKEFVKELRKQIKTNPMRYQMICFSSVYKGVGKTGTMIYLVKEYLKSFKNHFPNIEGSPVTWVSATGFVNMVYKEMGLQYKSQEEREEHKKYMDSVNKNQVLVLDGLGDHFLKKNDNSDENFVASKIEALIRYRQDNNLSTLATSNYLLSYSNQDGEIRNDLDEKNPSILKKYGERVVGLWCRGDSFWYNWETETSIRGICHTNEALSKWIK